jgi:uncharacterized protein (TIGR03905 family)
MIYEYRPSGVCSTKISVQIEDGIIKDVKFTGGCNGNTQGLSKLAVGRKADEVIEILSGIKCGFRNTSCPDQLAKALRTAINNE